MKRIIGKADLMSIICSFLCLENVFCLIRSCKQIRNAIPPDNTRQERFFVEKASELFSDVFRNMRFIHVPVGHLHYRNGFDAVDKYLDSVFGARYRDVEFVNQAYILTEARDFANAINTVGEYRLTDMQSNDENRINMMAIYIARCFSTTLLFFSWQLLARTKITFRLHVVLPEFRFRRNDMITGYTQSTQIFHLFPVDPQQVCLVARSRAPPNVFFIQPM